MTTKIIVPTLGESITDATLSKWFKSIGDRVSEDEAICELETEKVTLEVPSPVPGIIKHLAVAVGSDIAVGELLCTVEKADAEELPSMQQQKLEKSPSTDSSSVVKSSPSARVQAETLGIDLTQVVPTGGLGSVTKQDVENMAQRKKIEKEPPRDAQISKNIQEDRPVFVEPSNGSPKNATSLGAIETASQSLLEKLPPRPEDERGEKRVPMSNLRRAIAERLKKSQNTAAMLTTFNEVDMTNIVKLRATYQEEFIKKYSVKLGYMGFFVKVSAKALEQFPVVNAEIYGKEIIYKQYQDIGIAVSTPKGLVVPILRNAQAQDMSVAQIEKIIADFGIRAKKAQLTMKEMIGGTFTITNGGVFGSLLSTPIINPPQSAILGLHKIQKRPVVIDDTIKIRQMMYLALSYDHRLIDGREAVLFLARIKELLEDPERLLIGV